MKAAVRGIEIAYDRTGSGEPVLLVMGLATTRIGWFNQVQALSDRYEVVCFDNRGVGGSTAPHEAWTMADMADDAVALLDHLGWETAHVIGVSMGGMISQEIVLRHPDRVRTLTLIATHHGADCEQPSAAVFEALTHPEPAERLRRGVVHTFGRTYRAKHPEVVEMAVAFALENPPPEHGAMNQLMAIASWTGEGGTRDRLGDISAPTLVIHGGEDELVPPANGEMLADRIPDAKLVFIPDSGHAIIQEHAATVNAAILDHLGS